MNWKGPVQLARFEVTDHIPSERRATDAKQIVLQLGLEGSAHCPRLTLLVAGIYPPA
jgi:hypothetical protein